MAASINGILPPDLQNSISSSKVLVVGAGGIGCELLKNLALTGFNDVHIIDLDTIDVSNLNRQFLFRREHVGQPKALIAKESALSFNPNMSIIAYLDSITESKYDVNFFKQFSVVMNALDNRTARSHVNRMCLAAKIPLIESGSAGYNGHVALHKKGISECFDCTERPHQKTFPGCTIRNTPSEPIHCIVWAKHLFNQLFGVTDPDEDVSPDSADPEAVGAAGSAALAATSNGGAQLEKVSTRQWAEDISYDSSKLFTKFFNEDIKYLLSMENLWAKRRAPTPLDLNNLPDAVPCSSTTPQNVSLIDQRIWSILECFKIFQKCCTSLMESSKNSKGEPLIWDKDDDIAMDFVTACSNIRCHIFGLEQKSRFDTKSMAGNIIPAIASTNAVVAGLITTTAFNVLLEQYHKCHTLYVTNRSNSRKELFAVDKIVAPNPKCYVCAEKPEIALKIDVSKMTVRALNERVLKKELNMIAPDVEVDDGQGTILISSEEGETDDIADKLLQDFKIKEGTRLKCDDFLQNYQLNITISELHVEEHERERASELFEIIGDLSKLAPQDASEVTSTSDTNGNSAQPGPSKSTKNDVSHVSVVEDEDDILVIDAVDEKTNVQETPHATKRTLAEEAPIVLPAKKRKFQPANDQQEVQNVPAIQVVDLE